MDYAKILTLVVGCMLFNTGYGDQMSAQTRRRRYRMTAEEINKAKTVINTLHHPDSNVLSRQRRDWSSWTTTTKSWWWSSWSSPTTLSWWTGWSKPTTNPWWWSGWKTTTTHSWWSGWSSPTSSTWSSWNSSHSSTLWGSWLTIAIVVPIVVIVIIVIVVIIVICVCRKSTTRRPTGGQVVYSQAGATYNQQVYNGQSGVPSGGAVTNPQAPPGSYPVQHAPPGSYPTQQYPSAPYPTLPPGAYPTQPMAGYPNQTQPTMAPYAAPVFTPPTSEPAAAPPAYETLQEGKTENTYTPLAGGT